MLSVLIIIHTDSLSLSLFGALRGLRDAVAPESENNEQESSAESNANASTPSSSNNNQSMDYDDFLMAYHKGEPFALELIKLANGKPPASREEFIQLRDKNEAKKQSELVPKLAQNVLSKSAAVDDLVSALPGMHRTRAEQMERISFLMEQNQAAEEELKLAYEKAEEKRDIIRSTLQEVTCKALGIEQEG